MKVQHALAGLPFLAVLKAPGLSEDSSDLALLNVSQRAFPDWFVGLIGSAGLLCALVPGSMLLIASATTVARNVYRGLNPSASDQTVTALTKILVPVIALGGVAFVFSGGQTIVTLLLLGYALVTQLFPALLLSLVRPGRATRAGAIAGIVVGVGVVAGDDVQRRDPRLLDDRRLARRRAAVVPGTAEPRGGRAARELRRHGAGEHGDARHGAGGRRARRQGEPRFSRAPAAAPAERV